MDNPATRIVDRYLRLVAPIVIVVAAVAGALLAGAGPEAIPVAIVVGLLIALIRIPLSRWIMHMGDRRE